MAVRPSQGGSPGTWGDELNAWLDLLATQAELDAHAALAELLSRKGAASGYAGLDANVFVPAAQLARYRTAAPVAVGPSDASEVTLINQTIPGGLLGVTGALRCTIDPADWLNNGSLARSYTLRVYAGGTKIYDSVGVSSAISGNRRALFLQMVFANRGSAAINDLSGLSVSGNANTPTTGISTLASVGTTSSFGSGPTTIDTSIAWIFKATLQLSAAESTLEMRISQVLLEVL